MTLMKLRSKLEANSNFRNNFTNCDFHNELETIKNFRISNLQLSTHREQLF